MIAKIYTATRPGFNPQLITVEADILNGLPNLTIVGLPDHAVRESRDRVRSAITNSGFYFPAKHIIINLSPNDTPKEGGLIEAAMATAILVASGQIPQDCFNQTAILGALSLDGSVTIAQGLAAAAVFASSHPEIKKVILAGQNLQALFVADSTELFVIKDLSDLLQFAHGGAKPQSANNYVPEYESPDIRVENIFGLEVAKRALAIAAVGRHHLIMVGSPGSGKSLLARAYRYLLPPMAFLEAAEVTRIYSLAGINQGELVRIRPFRSPHHTASTPALVGGSSNARPGEITLAHHGTLFLDELPEFRNDVLQSLREPLEEKKISVARAKGVATYPADFQLIAAANPCRCGALFNARGGAVCTCPKQSSLLQFSKLVGPFLDRISIELNLNDLPSALIRGEIYTTESLRGSIDAAQRRAKEENGGKLNSELSAAELYRFFAPLNPATLYDHYGNLLKLSMRSWLNALRVAKSIANFDGEILAEHFLHEALQYRFIQERLNNFHQRAA